jgi:WD40 repeat protein
MSGYGRWIVSGSGDKTVRIWSVENKNQEAILTGHTDSVRSVWMSGDERWIVYGSGEKPVRIWSVMNKTQEAVITRHTDWYIY